jgi:hypothetical protein
MSPYISNLRAYSHSHIYTVLVSGEENQRLIAGQLFAEAEA